jgi:F-type H+-transporting ATPase subunit delta
VADTSQLISGVAERYASSLFDVAKEAGSIDDVGRDLDRFEALMGESADLKRLVLSPVFSADEQFRAMSALIARAGMTGLFANFLKVVARNRRLFALPGIIRAYRVLNARHRGEVSADVTSAHELSADQQRDLKTALKDVTGKDVTLNITIDPSILGGLIVKVGSRQIDTSLRTKLSSLKLALKEVG